MHESAPLRHCSSRFTEATAFPCPRFIPALAGDKFLISRGILRAFLRPRVGRGTMDQTRRPILERQERYYNPPSFSPPEPRRHVRLSAQFRHNRLIIRDDSLPLVEKLLQRSRRDTQSCKKQTSVASVACGRQRHRMGRLPRPAKNRYHLNFAMCHCANCPGKAPVRIGQERPAGAIPICASVNLVRVNGCRF